MILYMNIAPVQGLTTLWGRNIDVNRKALSLYPFVESFKEISLKSEFKHFFSWFNTFKVIGLLVPEKKIFKFFTIYGHGGRLGHMTWTVCTNFRSPIPWRRHMKIDFDWPSGFWGEDVWRVWTTDERMTEAYLSYKLTNEPSAQVS